MSEVGTSEVGVGPLVEQLETTETEENIDIPLAQEFLINKIEMVSTFKLKMKSILSNVDKNTTNI